MAIRSVAIGLGVALPKHCVPNDALPAHLDTSDEWIRGRTGITQRYLASEGETTVSLATQAAHKALSDAGLQPHEIDLILLATSTPDQTMPSAACLVQAGLGNQHAAALDVNAACSGFVYAMTLANAMLQTGQAKRALVIGAETMSRIVNWQDRGTCVLFGDGAGALILEAQEGSDRGILTASISADGGQHSILGTDGGISTTQQAGHLFMQGKEVFRHAVDKMASAFESVVATAGLTSDAIDWVIPHQANARIIQSIAKKSGLPEERFIMTLDRHANTSAASIPLALNAGVEEGRIKPQNILAFPALGAGLTWGCCIIRW